MLFPAGFVAKPLLFGVIAGTSGVLTFVGVRGLMNYRRKRKRVVEYYRSDTQPDLMLPSTSDVTSPDSSPNEALVSVAPPPAHSTLVVTGNGRIVITPQKKSKAKTTADSQRSPESSDDTGPRSFSEPKGTVTVNDRVEVQFSGAVVVRVKSASSGIQFFLNGKTLIELPIGVKVTIQDDGSVEFGTLFSKYVHVNNATNLDVSKRSRATVRNCEHVEAYHLAKVAISEATSVIAHGYCHLICRHCNVVSAKDHSYVEATRCGSVTVSNEAQAVVKECGSVIAEDMAVLVHEDCERVFLRDGAQEAGSITRKQVRNAIMWVIRR